MFYREVLLGLLPFIQLFCTLYHLLGYWPLWWVYVLWWNSTVNKSTAARRWDALSLQEWGSLIGNLHYKEVWISSFLECLLWPVVICWPSSEQGGYDKNIKLMAIEHLSQLIHLPWQMKIQLKQDLICINRSKRNQPNSRVYFLIISWSKALFWFCTTTPPAAGWRC